MNAPHAHLVYRCEDGGTREDKHRWFTSHRKALKYANKIVGRYHYAQVVTLADEGRVDMDIVEWQPKPYAGGTKRAFISVPLNGVGGFFHRQPVDCTLPTRFSDDDDPPQLNEERTYWVVRTEHGDTWQQVQEQFGGRWGECQCGTWQEIEGIPSKVDELVVRYPLAVTP